MSKKQEQGRQSSESNKPDATGNIESDFLGYLPRTLTSLYNKSTEPDSQPTHYLPCFLSRWYKHQENFNSLDGPLMLRVCSIFDALQKELKDRGFSFVSAGAGNAILESWLTGSGVDGVGINSIGQKYQEDMCLLPDGNVVWCKAEEGLEYDVVSLTSVQDVYSKVQKKMEISDFSKTVLLVMEPPPNTRGFGHYPAEFRRRGGSIIMWQSLGFSGSQLSDLYPIEEFNYAVFADREEDPVLSMFLPNHKKGHFRDNCMPVLSAVGFKLWPEFMKSFCDSAGDKFAVITEASAKGHSRWNDEKSLVELSIHNETIAMREKLLQTKTALPMTTKSSLSAQPSAVVDSLLVGGAVSRTDQEQGSSENKP